MSDRFLSGVIVNEHGEPVIGVPISKIAVKYLKSDSKQLQKIHKKTISFFLQYNCNSKTIKMDGEK